MMENKSSPKSSYGSAGDWSKVIQGISQGAGSAMQASSASNASKKDIKEAKRRTLANILNQAMKRDRNLFRAKQEHADEMKDYQNQALMQMAKSFAQGL